MLTDACVFKYFPTRALNIPVDVCYIETECKSLVVQFLWRGWVNHANHRLAASTEQVHDQTTEGKITHTHKKVKISMWDRLSSTSYLIKGPVLLFFWEVSLIILSSNYKMVVVSFTLFLFEWHVFYDELTRQWSSSSYRKREKLEFRCTLLSLFNKENMCMNISLLDILLVYLLD